MTLLDIKDYLKSLLNSYAALLDLELTIVNAEPMCRVAGTGAYAEERDALFNRYWNRWETSYSMQVIQSGQPLTVMDTTEYLSGMPPQARKFYSNYYSVILHPIYSGKRIVGVITVASFDEPQQQQLIAKCAQLKDYLARTATFISLRLEQDLLQAQTDQINRQLQLVTENMENGVLLYSIVDGIKQINSRAKEILHMDDKEVFSVLLKEVIRIADTADVTKEKVTQEIFCSVKKHSFFLNVQAIPLQDDSRDVLCIVVPFVQIQNAILQHTAGMQMDNDIVATTEVMSNLVERVKTAAAHSSNVLVLGESGTGKEMFARMIHSNSDRRDKPFVSVNCAAIPETLLESELFGYEEGAFTGAKKGGRIGKFMLADKGTLFLDEIGDMPLFLQAKLLRVLSERKVDRLGGGMPIYVDVRVVAATNRNLEEMINTKQFRADLYYRISVIPFEIPPLRERTGDIIPLIKYFIVRYNKKLGTDIRGIEDGALRLLLSYNWPGNVRELENCMEYMMNFERGNKLSASYLPPAIQQALQESQEKLPDGQDAGTPDAEKKVFLQGLTNTLPLKEMLARYERTIFENFAASRNGHPTLEEIDEFCAMLNISRATYYRKTGKSS